MLKAVLSYPMHPEHGIVTVSFPIPGEEYDRTLQLLEDVDIGDVLRRDCHVIELDSRYPILKRLESKVVNVDELDYLAKRLESFCKSEGDQFQAMAHKLDLSDITDLINLTFCCQQATVIADFSDLEAVGRAHYMNIYGSCAVDRELANLDGYETALLLIDSGAGVVTPYGVVYDNGMKLEQLYDGRYFPSYLYGPSVMAVEAGSDSGAVGCFCLPMPARQLQRIQERAGLENPDIPLKDVMDELPEETSNALDLDRLTLGDLADLNRLCQIIGTLKSPDDRKKMDAVVCAAHPDRIDRIQMLAENLELFDFVPGVHTPEEYGRYMIQQSGRFEYDENLADFYYYRLYGEQRVREDSGRFNVHGYVAYRGILTLEELMADEPAERQALGPQMGGQLC